MKQRTNVMLLNERVERNYTEYRERMLMLCGECVFEFAAEIAAVRKVYKFITENEYINEREAAILLCYGNPLKTLADAWIDYENIDDEEFDDYLSGFVKYSPYADDADDEDDFEFEESDGDARSKEAYFAELMNYCEKQLNIKIVGVLYAGNSEGEGADF